LKPKCDEPLSKFAFKFSLRHYTEDGGMAGRRRLTVSKSVLKARLVSTLESKHMI
jgi:hypothetical protein